MIRRVLPVLLLFVLGGAPLEAQRLRDRIGELFTFGTCGRPLCLDGSVNAANGHGDHFIPDLIAGNAAVIRFVTDAIGASASSVPLSAAGGGVTFRFVGGLPVRTAESSGPIFAERALTLGRGRVVLGSHLSGLSFTSIRGAPLDDVVLNFTHQDVGQPGLGDPVLENDLLQIKLDLDVKVQVASFFASWGVSDALDLGVAIPLVHSSIQGRSSGQIFPFGSTAVHFFTGTPGTPGLRASAATFGSSTGIGDIALRAKANLRGQERLSIGLLADARLPTGREADFLGAGTFSIRTLALASSRWDEFTGHLNAGYLLRTGTDRRDAVLLTAGFDQLLASWATLAVEVLTEWETTRGQELPGTVTYAFPFLRTIEPTNIPDRRDDRAQAAIGFKFQARSGPTIVTNLLLPMLRGGLQPDVTWGLGLDFSF